MQSAEEPPAVRTKTAVVVVGSTVSAVRAIGGDQHIELRANRHGVLVLGRPGDRVIDYAELLDGPVYDILYNVHTGWFSVTIFRRGEAPARWDNRPDEHAGYTRVPDVLGGTTPTAILDALDVPVALLGYLLS